MANQNPRFVLGLGDYQYEYGSSSAFASGFQPQMVNNGVPLAKIKPVAGPTHDVTSGADSSNYFTNWGRDPFTPYAFNVGKRWHIIALPSPVYRYAMDPQRAEVLTWLNQNLANHAGFPCTIAYWHEPFFTNNSSSHSATEGDYTKPWVDSLYAHHADILLAGHQHDYQRFGAQTPDKVADPAGLRQFVVGTGGVGFYSLSSGEPNLVTQNSDTYGALRLTLYYHRWVADFLPSGGGSFTDHVGAQCN